MRGKNITILKECRASGYTIRSADRKKEKEDTTDFKTENKESKKNKERFLVSVSLTIFIQFSLPHDQFHKY